MPSEEAFVHPPQISCEQRRLIAPGAGADLDDGRPVIQRVARDQQRLERVIKLPEPKLECDDLAGGLGGEFGVVTRCHLARLDQFALGLAHFSGQSHHVLQALVLLAQRCQQLRVAHGARIQQFLLHDRRPGHGIVKEIAQAHGPSTRVTCRCISAR